MEQSNGFADGFTIKIVSKRTGLSQHLIRMWERRYQAVMPQRTETNRRLYSENDIEKLSLLREATFAGHSIGRIANLSLDQLKEIVAQDSEAAHPETAVSSPEQLSPESFLERCSLSIEKFDTDAIEKTLMQASVTLSQPDIIEKIIAPLMVRVGESWQQGTLRTAHEHAISGIIRTFLGNYCRAQIVSEHAPTAIITTPAGQLHEIGALMAAVTAAADGWQITYLGPNLPAREIAVATISKKAKAVLLSIVYPQDDPYLIDELIKLREYLPENTAIIIGGRAARAYQPYIKSANSIVLHDLQSLHRELESLRLAQA